MILDMGNDPSCIFWEIISHSCVVVVPLLAYSENYPGPNSFTVKTTWFLRACGRRVTVSSSLCSFWISPGPGHLWSSCLLLLLPAHLLLSFLSCAVLTCMVWMHLISPNLCILYPCRNLNQAKGCKCWGAQPAFPGLGHYLNNSGHCFKGTSLEA